MIASNIGSLPELVRDGVNGYLFEAGNVKDLMEKIRVLDSDLMVEKMGYESRRCLDERFSPEAHYQTLMNLFEEQLKREKRK